MSANGDFDAVRRPIEEARCLPAQAYTTERFLEIELPERGDTLFSNRWICIGLVDDVPERGDATPREVAGKSVIMTREHGGRGTTSAPCAAPRAARTTSKRTGSSRWRTSSTTTTCRMCTKD